MQEQPNNMALGLPEGIYSGQIDFTGVPHGLGQMKYRNGSLYQGQWSSGQRHGRGVMVFSSGNRYEGDFCMNKRHGSGKFFYKELGDVYEGSWCNDMKDGKGEYRFKNGTIFKGGFKKDQRHGFGWKIQPNSVYCGDYFNGAKHGVFKFVLLNTEETSLVEYKNNKKVKVKSMGKLKPSDKEYLKKMGLFFGANLIDQKSGKKYLLKNSRDKYQRFPLNEHNEKIDAVVRKKFADVNQGWNGAKNTCQINLHRTMQKINESYRVKKSLSPVSEKEVLQNPGNNSQLPGDLPELPDLQRENQRLAQSIAISKAQNHYKKRFESKLLSEIGEVSEHGVSVLSFQDRNNLFANSERHFGNRSRHGSYQFVDGHQEGVNLIHKPGWMSVQTLNNLDSGCDKGDADDGCRSTMDSQTRSTNRSLDKKLRPFD